MRYECELKPEVLPSGELLPDVCASEVVETLLARLKHNAFSECAALQTLSVCLQEVCNNAFKAGATTLTINISVLGKSRDLSAQCVQVHISDNGPGFTSKRLREVRAVLAKSSSLEEEKSGASLSVPSSVKDSGFALVWMQQLLVQFGGQLTIDNKGSDDSGASLLLCSPLKCVDVDQFQAAYATIFNQAGRQARRVGFSGMLGGDMALTLPSSVAGDGAELACVFKPPAPSVGTRAKTSSSSVVAPS